MISTTQVEYGAFINDVKQAVNVYQGGFCGCEMGFITTERTEATKKLSNAAFHGAHDPSCGLSWLVVANCLPLWPCLLFAFHHMLAVSRDTSNPDLAFGGQLPCAKQTLAGSEQCRQDCTSTSVQAVSDEDVEKFAGWRFPFVGTSRRFTIHHQKVG